MANELQKDAEAAFKRASDIKNVTLTIQEALKQTEEAQTAAQNKLDEAKERLQKAKETLSTSDDTINELEEKAKNATELVNKLKEITDNLKTEYIKITSNSKLAGNSAAQANDIATDLGKRQKDLDVSLSLI